jgi:hypothetical protein
MENITTNTESAQQYHFRNQNLLGLIILMGHVTHNSMKDCCSTDPTICIPVYPQAMSKNGFEVIWQAWY